MDKNPAIPESLYTVLQIAPTSLTGLLTAFSAAVGLTDDVAKLLMADLEGTDIDADAVLTCVHNFDFVVEDGPEWFFIPQVRRYLYAELKKEPVLEKKVHGILLDIVQNPDPHIIYPAYMRWGIGKAYHMAMFNVTEAIEIYRSCYTPEPSEVNWLIGTLLKEQQQDGWIPDDAIEPAFFLGMAYFKERNFQQAEHYLQSVVQEDLIREEVAVALYTLAFISLNGRHHIDGAVQNLQSCLTILEKLGDTESCKNVMEELNRIQALREQDTSQLATPEEVHATIWNRLPPDIRADILTITRNRDRDLWSRVWATLLFSPVPTDIAPHQWRQGISAIKDSYEKLHPELCPGSGRLSDTESIPDVESHQLTIMEAARSVLQKGNPELARKYVEDLIRRQKEEVIPDPVLANTYTQAGNIALETGFTELAEIWYQNAIEYHKEDITPYLGLAESFQRQNRYDDAEAIYWDAIKQWPENVRILNRLAETLKERNRLDDAELIYRQTIERWPDDVTAFIGLAETLKAQNKFAAAEAIYRKIIVKWPNNPDIYTGLADTLMRLDNLEEAETLYRQAGRKWPGNIKAMNGLAETLKVGDCLEEAEMVYRKTIESYPNDIIARQGLAATLKARDLLEEAENVCRESMMRWPKNVTLYNSLASILREQEKYEEAEQFCRKLIGRWPEEPESHINLARTLTAMNRWEEAKLIYRGIIDKWPANIHAYVGLVRILVAQGQLEKAELLCRRAVDQWPDEAIAHNTLALTLKVQDRFDEAEAIYRKTMERWPGNRTARNGLADVLRKCGRYSEAMLILPRISFSTNVQNQLDVHLRGMILLQTGKINHALSIFEGMLEQRLSQAGKRMFRSAIVVAKLKALDGKSAIMHVEQLPDDLPSNILLLHTCAITEDLNTCIPIHSRFVAGEFNMFPASEKVLRTLESIFCLKNGTELCLPSEQDHNALIDMEVDMLVSIFNASRDQDQE